MHWVPPPPPESPKTFLMTYFGKIKVDILVSNLSWQVQKTKQVWWKTNHKIKKTPKRKIPHIKFETCFQLGKSCQTETSFNPGPCPGSHIFPHMSLIFSARPLGTLPCVCDHFQSHSFAVALPSSPTAWVVEWLPGSRVRIKASARPVCV